MANIAGAGVGIGKKPYVAPKKPVPSYNPGKPLLGGTRNSDHYKAPPKPVVKPIVQHTARDLQKEKLAIINQSRIAATKPVAKPVAKPVTKPVVKPTVNTAIKSPTQTVAAPTRPAPNPVTATNPAATAKPPNAVNTPTFTAPGTPSLTYEQQLQQQIDLLYDNQKKSQLAELQAQRNKAIAGFNQQKTEVNTAIQGQKNQADVVNNQNVQRLREVMAASGLGASGENVTANIGLNNERQNSLNALNVQQQQQTAEINNQINAVNDPQEEQKIISSIEAQRSQALLDAKQKASDKAWREYTFNNMSATEKAQLEWAKQQYGEDAAWRLFQMKYQGDLQQSQSQAELDAYTGDFLTP